MAEVPTARSHTQRPRQSLDKRVLETPRQENHHKAPSTNNSSDSESFIWIVIGAAILLAGLFLK